MNEFIQVLHPNIVELAESLGGLAVQREHSSADFYDFYVCVPRTTCDPILELVPEVKNALDALPGACNVRSLS